MARGAKRGKPGDGVRSIDPFADVDIDGAPVDIAAVRRDDALIDAIAGDGPVATDSADEYQIATLLANWRAELVTPPLPAGPEIDDVIAAVNQEVGAREARQSAGKLRLLRPIAGAAAAVALVVGAMTAFSYSAQPGDPLWKVKEVVFSEQADSTMANRAANDDLAEAQRLMAAGNVAEAKVHLDRAQGRVGDVKDSEAHDELSRRINAMLDSVKLQLAPLTTPPAAPSTSRWESTVGTAEPTVPQAPEAPQEPTQQATVAPIPPTQPTQPPVEQPTQQPTTNPTVMQAPVTPPPPSTAVTPAPTTDGSPSQTPTTQPEENGPR